MRGGGGADVELALDMPFARMPAWRQRLAAIEIGQPRQQRQIGARQPEMGDDLPPVRAQARRFQQGGVGFFPTGLGRQQHGRQQRAIEMRSADRIAVRPAERG
jgi:hypothetical protein